MNQLFGAGLTISAIVILHNWMGVRYTGIVLSVWFASTEIGLLVGTIFFEPSREYFYYFYFGLAGIYVFLSGLSYCFYHHNP